MKSLLPKIFRFPTTKQHKLVFYVNKKIKDILEDIFFAFFDCHPMIGFKFQKNFISLLQKPFLSLPL